MTNCKEQ